LEQCLSADESGG